MTTPTFTPATPVDHRDALLALNVEYLTWLSAAIDVHFGINSQAASGMTVTEYVSSVLDTICGESPPRGIFYLVEVEQQVAGMGGLRWLRPGVAEVKRVYVRPAYRGMRVGAAIVRRLLDDARAFGYERVKLDTAPFMYTAQKLYEGLGFVDCAPYEETEVPEMFHPSWRFMERSW
jgi:GNAT superfamily N-acetyltransferase